MVLATRARFASCFLGILLGILSAGALCETLSVAIPSQPLPSALTEFSRQTGLQFVYVSQIAAGKLTKGAPAGLTNEAALAQLLEGTGLRYEFLNERTVRIYEPVASGTALPATSAPDESPATRSPTPSSGEIPNIVVVGLPYDQTLSIQDFVQNVPASVSVVSGNTLQTQRLEQLTDYANYIPGLDVAAGGSPGQALVTLRGTAALTEGSSIGYYLDDIPMGPSSIFARACCTGLDISPYDLDRLEVLRGPQGTTYGAEGEAGLIRYVLNAPNLSAFHAEVGADSSWLQGASSPGATARAMLNVPVLPDSLGVRVSAFDKKIPGYITEAHSGARDVNDQRQDGARLAALWLPLASLSVKLNVLWLGINAASDSAESTKGLIIVPASGNAYIVAPVGYYPDLTENITHSQPFKKNVGLYAVSLKWKVADVELDSATAWSSTRTEYTLDTTPVYSDLSGQLSSFDREIYLGKFTEELRLSSAQGPRVQWSLGAFYTHEVVRDNQSDDDPVSFYDQYFPSNLREWALFGNLTWRPVARVEMTAGLRNSREWSQQTASYTFLGNLFPSAPSPVLPQAGTTWMANAAYHFAPDIMSYARVATGYSPGASGYPARDQGLPTVIKPDSLTSYEAGYKSQFFDRRLVADLDFYYIVRKNVQLGYGDFGPDFLTNSGAETTYTANAGEAIAKGVDFEGFYSPLRGLKLGYSLAYTRSELNNPAVDSGTAVGPKYLSGYQLPNVPRWAVAGSSDYGWTLVNGWNARIGATCRWVGKEWGSTAAVQTAATYSTPSVQLPSYALANASAGIQRDRLALKAFVQNLTNRRAYLGAGVSQHYTDETTSMTAPVQINYAIAQPRTAGIGFDYSF